jgi:predicted transcriptional regulator
MELNKEKIDNLISEKGLKKVHIAKQLGISPSAFSHVMSPDRTDTLKGDQVLILAELLDVEVADLFL